MHAAVIRSPNRVYPIDHDWTMYGYGGNRSPDTVMAKSQKEVKMENEQNQYFDRDEFPPPIPNSFPSAPQQISANDLDFRYNSALHSVPVYSPPRNGNTKHGQ